jgi:hypothetical protein
MPFIPYHIKVFQTLSIPWHWHIIEGMAKLKYDTAWGLENGGQVPQEFHEDGLSVDGTTEYINSLLLQHKSSITVYRKPMGMLWEGKREMVNAPLCNDLGNCLLWQLDVDELWTKKSIEKVYKMFENNPDRWSAYFYCFYFLGLRKYIVSDGVKSTMPWDWLRVWRYVNGMKWGAHEPPILLNTHGEDVGKIRPFTREETLREKIGFQHFAYSTLESVLFKEAYYGYKGLVDQWKLLQAKSGRVVIGEGFPGVWPGTVVDDWDGPTGLDHG